MSFDIGSMIGGYSQGKATKEAAKMAYKASIYASQLQQAQYNQTRSDMMPWLGAGQRAVQTLEGKIAAGPGEYEKSKDYEFLMQQGTQARERGAAASGGLQSGAEQKALTEYGQGLASQDYDKWLNRWYQSLTPYQSMAGMGQTTGSQLGTLGGQSALNQGNFINQAGQIKAAGMLGVGNSIANTGSSLGQGVQNSLTQLMQQRQANQGLTQQSNTTNYGMGTLGNPGAGNIGFTGAEMSTMTWL